MMTGVEGKKNILKEVGFEAWLERQRTLKGRFPLAGAQVC